MQDVIILSERVQPSQLSLDGTFKAPASPYRSDTKSADMNIQTLPPSQKSVESWSFWKANLPWLLNGVLW